MKSFRELPIEASIQTALSDLEWSEPTPIQRETIPLLLQGCDLVGQAQTGTGKTGAFGIPLVQSALGRGRRGRLQALVLVPTRELAIQVTKDLNAIGRHAGVSAFAIYGGVGMSPQQAELRRNRNAIVVATPGRLLDHMQSGAIDLGTIETLVLDEADRMLDMGFIRDVERILRATPRERQTVLFSATLPAEIEGLARKFLVNPERVSVSGDELATPLAEQHVVHLDKAQKLGAFLHLLETERPERVIVFRRTRGNVQQMLRKLKARGVEAVALHGDLSQGQRERSLLAFREGHAPVLVATDVAARGLDIPDVTHVVNLDCPNIPESYVHRIGRTARAGRSGRTFLFVTPDDRAEHRDIERLLGERLAVYEMPDIPFEAPQAPAPQSGGWPPRLGGREGHPRGGGHGRSRGGGGYGGGRHGQRPHRGHGRPNRFR